nr:hypothetical protein CFP56_44612 [Quercus suber]
MDEEFINEDDNQDENIHEDEQINGNTYLTIGFTILKLECSTKVRSKYKYKRVMVDNLGDQVLFVGDSSSMSSSPSSFNGCKANCVYFTDDYKKGFSSTLNGGWFDIGVFSMEDGNINQHYRGESYS